MEIVCICMFLMSSVLSLSAADTIPKFFFIIQKSNLNYETQKIHMFDGNHYVRLFLEDSKLQDKSFFIVEDSLNAVLTKKSLISLPYNIQNNLKTARIHREKKTIQYTLITQYKNLEEIKQNREDFQLYSVFNEIVKLTKDFRFDIQLKNIKLNPAIKCTLQNGIHDGIVVQRTEIDINFSQTASVSNVTGTIIKKENNITSIIHIENIRNNTTLYPLITAIYKSTQTVKREFAQDTFETAFVSENSLLNGDSFLKSLYLVTLEICTLKAKERYHNVWSLWNVWKLKILPSSQWLQHWLTKQKSHLIRDFIGLGLLGSGLYLTTKYGFKLMPSKLRY